MEKSTYIEKAAYVKRVFGMAVAKGLCKTMTDFARLLDINPSSLSAALNTRPEYMTDKLVGRVASFAQEKHLEDEPAETDAKRICVIPYEARGGTIGDYVEGVCEYDCEKIVSPIKGADYAMEVTGDSMAPEYPSGSRVLIKRVSETFLAWGEVYVLDTPDGAVIKRIRKTDDPSVVECVSVNPAYQSFTVPKSFVRGWYRVLMVMSLK